RGGNVGGSVVFDYLDWKQRATSFEAMEGFRHDALHMGGERERRLPVVYGTPGFLDLIGARASLGRLLDDDDIRAGAPPVAVLAHEFWMSQFGADPDVVGQEIRLGE